MRESGRSGCAEMVAAERERRALALDLEMEMELGAGAGLKRAGALKV